MRQQAERIYIHIVQCPQREREEHRARYLPRNIRRSRVQGWRVFSRNFIRAVHSVVAGCPLSGFLFAATRSLYLSSESRGFSLSLCKSMQGNAEPVSALNAWAKLKGAAIALRRCENFLSGRRKRSFAFYVMNYYYDRICIRLKLLYGLSITRRKYTRDA